MARLELQEVQPVQEVPERGSKVIKGKTYVSDLMRVLDQRQKFDQHREETVIIRNAPSRE
jgi:hypothetical protein